jgi:NTP pyrophosphatase (non-canonical NTP hydrolase)
MADLSALATQVAAIYSDRFGAPQTAEFALLKMTEELGEVAGAYLRLTGQARGVADPSDLADEVADLFGFLLVFAARMGVDPAAELTRKWGAHLPAPPKG